MMTLHFQGPSSQTLPKKKPPIDQVLRNADALIARQDEKNGVSKDDRARKIAEYKTERNQLIDFFMKNPDGSKPSS